MPEYNNVLLVSDNTEFIDSLEGELSPLCNLTVANFADECFYQIEEKQRNLVVLDISVGDEEGAKICHSIKTTHMDELPVILVSSAASVAHHIVALEAGCDAYITYPQRRSQLFSTIDFLLSVRDDVSSSAQSINLNAFYELLAECISPEELSDALFTSVRALGIKCYLQIKVDGSLYTAQNFEEDDGDYYDVVLSNAGSENEVKPMGRNLAICLPYSRLLVIDMPTDDFGYYHCIEMTMVPVMKSINNLAGAWLVENLVSKEVANMMRLAQLNNTLIKNIVDFYERLEEKMKSHTDGLINTIDSFGEDTELQALPRGLQSTIEEEMRHIKLHVIKSFFSRQEQLQEESDDLTAAERRQSIEGLTHVLMADIKQRH